MTETRRAMIWIASVITAWALGYADAVVVVLLAREASRVRVRLPPLRDIAYPDGSDFVTVRHASAEECAAIVRGPARSE